MNLHDSTLKIVLHYCILPVLLSLDCLGQGKPELEKELPFFDEVEISGCNCMVEFVPERSYRVVVSSPNYLANKVDPLVVNGRLIFRYVSLIRKTDLITISIYNDELRKISIFGPADFRSTNALTGEKLSIHVGTKTTGTIEVQVNELHASLNDQSQVIIKGSVKNQTVKLQNNSVYRAYGLHSEFASVDLEAGCLAELDAILKLEGEAKYGGKVVYKNEPKELVVVTKYGGSVSKKPQ